MGTSRDYENDVYYEVWRRGGNPDRINEDRVEDAFHDGMDENVAAAREIRIQQERHARWSEDQEGVK